MTETGTERRRQERVDFVRPVRVYPLGEAGARRFFAINLSTGGMFLHGSQPLHVGRHLALEIDADAGPVRIEACEVVWERPDVSSGADRSGMGIRFLYMSDGDRQRLERLVDLARVEMPATRKRLGKPAQQQSVPDLVIMLGAKRDDPSDSGEAR